MSSKMLVHKLRAFVHILRILIILIFILSLTGGTIAYAGQATGEGGDIVEVQSNLPGLPTILAFKPNLIKSTNLAALTPPSPDSAGIAYIQGRNSLLVVDCDVEETVNGSTFFQGANAWELALDGSLLHTGNLSSIPYAGSFPLGMTNEPTGAAWNPNNGHYFISDDKAMKIFDLDPGPDGVPGTHDDGSWTSFSTLPSGNSDPEGMAYDPVNNGIFVVNGTIDVIFQYSTTGEYLGQFSLGDLGVGDPEGVSYNSQTGTLFVMSSSRIPAIVETTRDGVLLQEIDISNARPWKQADLAIGPASNGSGAKSFYIVARGKDNNGYPYPEYGDGMMYEMVFNASPVVNAGLDMAIRISDSAHLDGTVTDDTLPAGAVTSTWSKVSGPGTVTFGNVNAVDTTATFSSNGVYVLRLTATDGAGTRSDDVTVLVASYRNYLGLVFRN